MSTVSQKRGKAVRKPAGRVCPPNCVTDSTDDNLCNLWHLRPSDHDAIRRVRATNVRLTRAYGLRVLIEEFWKLQTEDRGRTILMNETKAGLRSRLLLGNKTVSGGSCQESCNILAFDVLGIAPCYGLARKPLARVACGHIPNACVSESPTRSSLPSFSSTAPSFIVTAAHDFRQDFPNP